MTVYVVVDADGKINGDGRLYVFFVCVCVFFFFFYVDLYFGYVCGCVC